MSPGAKIGVTPSNPMWVEKPTGEVKVSNLLE